MRDKRVWFSLRMALARLDLISVGLISLSPLLYCS